MNLRYLFSIILLINLADPVSAQITTKQIDSLNERAKEVFGFDSIKVMTEQIIAKSKAINYDYGLVTAALTNTAAHFNSHKFQEALKLTLIWEEKVFALKNHAKISQLYALRGDAYGRLLFFKQSREYLSKALAHAQKIPEQNLRYYSLSRIYIIMASNAKDDTSIAANADSVLFYLKKANQLQKKTLGKGNIRINYIISGNLIGNAFLRANNIDSAKVYFDRSIAFSKTIKIESYLLETYNGLGEVYFRKKKLDSSLFYYKTSLAVALKTTHSGDIKQSYRKLSIIYEQLNDMPKSYEYLKKYGLITDSLANADKNAIKSSSDIILEEKELAFTHTSKFYVLVIVASTLLLIGLLYILLIFSKNHKKTVAIHKQRQEHLSEKLAHLKEKTSSDKVDDQSLKEIIQLAVSNDPAFLIKFQEHHSIFIQKLMDRAPSLVTSDLLICAQLRLGFYTKEIARYTKNSVRAVEGKKYRIRKKLNIPANEDINVWMMQV